MSSASRAPSRGLPSNPRPRAKSAAAPSRVSPPDYRALPANPRSRHPPPQERARAPESTSRNVQTRPSRNAATPSVNDGRSSDNHSTASSSSGFSFWSRGTSNSSMASSKMISESEGDMDQRQAGQEDYLQGAKDTSEHSVDPKELAGLAWGRVAEVANVFTQEVSKVWTTGLTPLGGRAEGEGHDDDSHLTRVMRAYHLSKAQSPSDLPDWLFNERERGQLGGLLRSKLHDDDSREGMGADSAQDPNRSLSANNSNFASTRNSESRLKNIQNFAPPSLTPHPTKATGADRLKTIRDRRAGPANRR